MVLCHKRTTPRPRDGPWAWLVCFCCFSINVTTFGLILSYGVLLPVFIEEFKTSRGVTAWIGSLAMGLSFLFGPVCVKIVNFFGERPVGVCSGVITAALVFTSSFAKHIEMLFFTYGVLIGFFANCLVSSFTKSLQKYFKKHLGVASGISTSGGSIGVLVCTPCLQVLVDLLGWRSALKIMSGFVMLAGVACLSFDPNVESVKKVEQNNAEEEQSPRTKLILCGNYFDCSIWRSPNYTIATITIFLNFLCLYVPVVHLITFAKDLDIPPSKSSLVFIYVGITSTAVRIIIGKVVDRKWLTPLQCIQLSSYIIGLSLLLFTQAKVYLHLLLIMLCYAIGNGIFISTQYSYLLTCFDDIRKSYLGFSMCYTVTSFALLSGAPIAGFVADFFNSYVPAFYIFGGLIIFSGTLPFCLLLIPRKETSAELDARLQLIGFRLAIAESSLGLNL